jgi:hypothetical protein
MRNVLLLTLLRLIVVTSLTCYTYFHVSSTSQVGQGVTSFYKRTEDCALGVQHCLKFKGHYHLADFYFDYTRPLFDGGCGPATVTPEMAGNSVSIACPFSSPNDILVTTVTAKDTSTNAFLSFPLSAVFTAVAEYPYSPDDLLFADCVSHGAAGCVESGKLAAAPLSCGREGFRPVVYEILACTGNLCNSASNVSISITTILIILSIFN